MIRPWTTPEGRRRAARKYEAARPEFERRNAEQTRRELDVLGRLLRVCLCAGPFPTGHAHEPGCPAAPS